MRTRPTPQGAPRRPSSRGAEGDSEAMPAVVHLRVFAPGDFILARGPAVKPTVESDERERLRDRVTGRSRSEAVFCALASFNRAHVLYPAA